MSFRWREGKQQRDLGTGGNIRGNEAFNFWTKARDGVETQGTLDWIKEREHGRRVTLKMEFADGAQSNIAKRRSLNGASLVS